MSAWLAKLPRLIATSYSSLLHRNYVGILRNKNARTEDGSYINSILWFRRCSLRITDSEPINRVRLQSPTLGLKDNNCWFNAADNKFTVKHTSTELGQRSNIGPKSERRYPPLRSLDAGGICSLGDYNWVLLGIPLRCVVNLLHVVNRRRNGPVHLFLLRLLEDDS